MSAAVNKRQQVRNERTLQDLIKNVPGNDRCADCAAKNPGWASWSLGIFLCMRCAALHRKLGTHISKVKSLSMDSWTNEQVENMKRIGNTTSNQLYNPRNTKASMPMDVDEVDGVMERFIRQKYEHKSFNDSISQPGSRQNTGSTSSDDRPPPLPPKPSKRFHFPGLRSASSPFQRSRSGGMSPPVSPGVQGYGREPSPPPKDKKHTRFLGAEVGDSRDDNFDTKLSYLRDMGFTNESRNLKVLKGLNGNVDKTVETLIRLGEGNTRSVSPLPPPTSLPPKDGPSNGISWDKPRGPPTPSKTNNPFDQLDVQNKSLPQLPEHPELSPQNTYNPFLHPNQQQLQQPQPTLDQSFQNMQLSQPPPLQPPQLFPNSTGGYSNQNNVQTNPFLQTYTPPPIAQYNQYPMGNPFALPSQQQQYMQPQPTGQAPNPFLRTSRSQVFNNSNAFGNQATFGYNGVQQTYNAPLQEQQAGQGFSQQQPQAQQSHYNPFQQAPVQQMQQQQQQQQQHQQQPTSPFEQQQSFQQSPFAPQQQQFQQAAPMQQQQYHQSDPLPQGQFQSPASAPPQQQHLFQPPVNGLQHQNTFPMRQDTSSILALYKLAPPRQEPILEAPAVNGTSQVHPAGVPKRSVTMPVVSNGQVSGTMNPFAALAPQLSTNGAANAFHAPNMNTPISAVPANAFRHVSNESVDFGGHAMMNGRHSPDAFSGLSARMR